MIFVRGGGKTPQHPCRPDHNKGHHKHHRPDSWRERRHRRTSWQESKVRSHILAILDGRFHRRDRISFLPSHQSSGHLPLSVSPSKILAREQRRNTPW